MSKSFLKNTDAVSPVVGVMLMLVVTVIIAAVVSAYSSGMIVNTQKAPTGSFDCKISNGGSWGNSGFSLSVMSVSEPIQTKDVKLTTSWVTTNKDKPTERISDTVATIGLQHPLEGKYSNDGNSYIDHYGTVKKLQSPLGYGPGVQNTTADFTKVTINEQNYGNYLLTAGTTLVAKPYGKDATTGGYGIAQDKRYEYTKGNKYDPKTIKTDEMGGILGSKWYNLRPGDVVNVRLTYMPTGSVLFEKDVIVE